MARKHHKPEKIVAKLRQVEVFGRAGQVSGRCGADDWGNGGDLLPLAL
jgi:hypothetical protein